MDDKRIKRKMVKTDADATHAQSVELLELNTMSSSLYTDRDVITLEYQSQNHLDFPTLARECDRYRISDRAAASLASRESTKLTVSRCLLTGLYFEGRKDNTKVLIKKDTKYCPKTTKQEHYILVNEPSSVYIGYATAATGGTKAIKEAILNLFCIK
ncbi:hypothetical protein AVEN_70891-1 [Araneus ventricosus]|uniref:Uncharacterized protein n=1 Tax=Araneus ventricosus TaxID=182803 RepID=A0A4Y2X727_ARAVE|nr:hypothetical protein AVEN_70891-1 [Araneus ventricosus]